MVGNPTEYIINEKTGCWEWQKKKNPKGYGQKKRNGRNQLAHTWYYEEVFGPVPKGLELDHFVCQNRGCVNPFHLEAVTHTENIRRGSATKLNWEKVNFIRELYNTGWYTRARLARLFYMSESQIGFVVTYRSWRVD